MTVMRCTLVLDVDPSREEEVVITLIVVLPQPAHNSGVSKTR